MALCFYRSRSVLHLQSGRVHARSRRKGQKTERLQLRWVFLGISAAALVAGTTLAVVYNNKAKSESEKMPASREEFNQRHDDIGKYQKYRTAGIGIAIVGGIGLGISLAF